LTRYANLTASFFPSDPGFSLTQRLMGMSGVSPHPLEKCEGHSLKLQPHTAQQYQVFGWDCPRTKWTMRLLQFF